MSELELNNMNQEGIPVTLGILNISMLRPHNPARYVSLFEQAKKKAKLKKSIQIHGDHHAILQSMVKLNESSPVSMLTGEIYRFIEIDVDEDWYNIVDGDVASEEDLEKVNIPEHLRPHMKRIRYVFDPDTHRLVFVSKIKNDKYASMSAAWTKRFFDVIFNDPHIIVEFGEIEVTIEQSPSELERILAFNNIESLTFEINRPNPDDTDQFATDIEEYMLGNNAKRMEINLSAPRGENLNITDHNKNLGILAISNGKVTARVRDSNGAVVPHATKNAAASETLRWDESFEEFRTVFIDKAKQIFQRFRK